MQVSAARSQTVAGVAQGNAAGSQAAASVHGAAADRAAIESARAQLAEARANLNHTVITSPVDGTVIARNVSVGQTVAASFQTPTLYTIAKDLKKMEVDVAVGEPDIGAVRAGQKVEFTVLAYPNDTFHGVVAQVRENPTTIQNVVTYDTVVYEDNSDGRLRPGMTANASIHIAQVKSALVVPLAALRYRPRSSTPRANATARPAPQSAWGNTGTSESSTIGAGRIAQVTVAGLPRPVSVRVLLVSGGEAAIQPLAGRPVEGDHVALAGAAPQRTQAPQRPPSLFR